MSGPELRLIDCHLHLQDPALLLELDEVLDRARDAGVRRFVCNGSREDDWEVVASIADDHPDVIPCFGLHPWYVKGRSDSWLEDLEAFLRERPSAVGEIGLDRWKEGRDEAAQEEVFRAQLDLARRLGRPVMVHCLQAWGWLQDILGSEPARPPGMLIHAYGGPADLLGPLAKLGAYFSFAGDTLFEHKKTKQESARAVPLDRILLETDAPDILPPPEYRTFELEDVDGSEKTDPSCLRAILGGVARLRGEDEATLATAVWENARRLFGDLFPEAPSS